MSRHVIVSFQNMCVMWFAFLHQSVKYTFNINYDIRIDIFINCQCSRSMLDEKIYKTHFREWWKFGDDFSLRLPQYGLHNVCSTLVFDDGNRELFAGTVLRTAEAEGIAAIFLVDVKSSSEIDCPAGIGADTVVMHSIKGISKVNSSGSKVFL